MTQRKLTKLIKYVSSLLSITEGDASETTADRTAPDQTKLDPTRPARLAWRLHSRSCVVFIVCWGDYDQDPKSFIVLRLILDTPGALVGQVGDVANTMTGLRSCCGLTRCPGEESQERRFCSGGPRLLRHHCDSHECLSRARQSSPIRPWLRKQRLGMNSPVLWCRDWHTWVHNN